MGKCFCKTENPEESDALETVAVGTLTENGPAGLNRMDSLALGLGDISVENSPHHLEWINYTLRKLWPYAEKALFEHIKEVIEPAVQTALPGVLSGFHFDKFSIGDTPPVLGPLKVYEKTRHDHHGIEFDFGIDWKCDCDINVSIPGVVDIGVKNFRFQGEGSIVLRPLMHQFPIVGGVQLFMISPPVFDWDFTGAAAFADRSVVSSALRKCVLDSICDLLVLPNRVFYHWVRDFDIDMTAMQYPIPEGLVRICVVEGRNLKGMDWAMFGNATSDPYATLRVGACSHRTPTKQHTVAPKWGDSGWGDFVCFNAKQLVHLEVHDHDATSTDDLIGRLERVTVGELLANNDKWYKIMLPSNKKENGDAASDDGNVELEATGEVRVIAQEFNFSSTRALLKKSPKAKGSASAKALLTVQVRCLRGLPTERTVGAHLKVIVDGQTFLSRPSTFRQAHRNLSYDFDAQVIDPGMQRMAEHLATEFNYPIEKICEVSGIDKQSMENILKHKPSFTTGWHQGFNILVKNLDSTMQLQLILPEKAGVLSSSVTRTSTSFLSSAPREEPPQLEKPFKLSDLASQENMRFEGVLYLKGTIGSLGKDKDAEEESKGQQRFDLDIQLQLWGLRGLVD